MKKNCFILTIDNAINLITNSSSELFILKGENKELVREMVEETCPNYTDEFTLVENIADLDEDSLMSFFDTYLYTYSRNHFEIIEFYEKKLEGTDISLDDVFDNWDEFIMSESNSFYPTIRRGYNLKKLAEKIDPENKMFFIASIHDNPSYEKTEQLEKIGQRYHY